jgi:hypothetical protein
MWITTLYHPDASSPTPEERQAITSGYVELARLQEIDGNGGSIPGFGEKAARDKIDDWNLNGGTKAVELVLKRIWNTEACAREWNTWCKNAVPKSTVTIEESID